LPRSGPGVGAAAIFDAGASNNISIAHNASNATSAAGGATFRVGGNRPILINIRNQIFKGVIHDFIKSVEFFLLKLLCTRI